MKLIAAHEQPRAEIAERAPRCLLQFICERARQSLAHLCFEPATQRRVAHIVPNDDVRLTQGLVSVEVVHCKLRDEDPGDPFGPRSIDAAYAPRRLVVEDVEYASKAPQRKLIEFRQHAVRRLAGRHVGLEHRELRAREPLRQDERKQITRLDARIAREHDDPLARRCLQNLARTRAPLETVGSRKAPSPAAGELMATKSRALRDRRSRGSFGPDGGRVGRRAFETRSGACAEQERRPEQRQALHDRPLRPETRTVGQEHGLRGPIRSLISHGAADALSEARHALLAARLSERDRERALVGDQHAQPTRARDGRI